MTYPNKKLNGTLGPNKRWCHRLESSGEPKKNFHAGTCQPLVLPSKTKGGFRKRWGSRVGKRRENLNWGDSAPNLKRRELEKKVKPILKKVWDVVGVSKREPKTRSKRKNGKLPPKVGNLGGFYFSVQKRYCIKRNPVRSNEKAEKAKTHVVKGRGFSLHTKGESLNKQSTGRKERDGGLPHKVIRGWEMANKV